MDSGSRAEDVCVQMLITGLHLELLQKVECHSANIRVYKL